VNQALWGERSYGTRSPVQEHTPRIKTILKVPDGLLNS
jgi:hypothetical protein